MSNIVLDSGILIADILPDKLSAQAGFWLERMELAGTSIHVPVLFRYEVISVVRKAVHQKRISPEKGRLLCEHVLSYIVTLHFDDALLRRAYELAGSLGQPTAYDTQYLALAERLACEFWTADERLYNGVRSDFPPIRWLGSVDLSG